MMLYLIPYWSWRSGSDLVTLSKPLTFLMYLKSAVGCMLFCTIAFLAAASPSFIQLDEGNCERFESPYNLLIALESGTSRHCSQKLLVFRICSAVACNLFFRSLFCCCWKIGAMCLVPGASVEGVAPPQKALQFLQKVPLSEPPLLCASAGWAPLLI